MLPTELARCKQRAINTFVGADPFIFSPQFVNELHLLSLASLIVKLSNWLRPALPAGPGGRPVTYRDESILVTIFVMSVWQLSPEIMVRRMKRWPELALACGFIPGAVISSSQLRRRRDNLGIWVYFVTFCLLVAILIRRGVILGRDWVIDSTIIDAFTLSDTDARWSFSKRFGYKVHMLICRDSLLPIMFLVSPANANDGPWATRLMALVHRLFALPVTVVRADAAYYTKAVLLFIVNVLGATPKVVYNPRKAGKKFLVTLEWVAQYRQDRGKRGYIERLFAFLKQYYRLNDLRRTGLWHAYRHVSEVCFSVLLVAWLAHHVNRPDLMHSRSRLLAPCKLREALETNIEVNETFQKRGIVHHGCCKQLNQKEFNHEHDPY
ncbi:MAG: IS4/IS5 family transposase, partial [Chloroflexi bacterium]